MSHTVEVIKAIKFYSGKKQIDYKALAKASGLNISTIRKLFHSKQPVNIDWLLKGINVNYWRELPIDTKVEVYHEISGQWLKRHYAGFENDKIYCFKYGESSWTSRGEKIELEIDEIRVCE